MRKLALLFLLSTTIHANPYMEEVNVLYTTIDTLNGRIAALKLEATKEMTESEKMQEELEPIPFNTFT